MSRTSVQQYTIHFYNDSNNDWCFCLFQQIDSQPADVFSLAWFAQLVTQGTGTKFPWSIDYNFVWASTGTLQPGVIFSSMQTVDADLDTANQIGLTYNGTYPNGDFAFTTTSAITPEGTLFINEDNTIPAGAASVGIGMSGQGVFAVQAEQNINFTFTPEPAYWCTFGDSFQNGQVLNLSILLADNIVPIQFIEPVSVLFPTDVYTMYVTATTQNTLSVSSTAPNKDFAAEKSKSL